MGRITSFATVRRNAEHDTKKFKDLSLASFLFSSSVLSVGRYLKLARPCPRRFALSRIGQRPIDQIEELFSWDITQCGTFLKQPVAQERVLLSRTLPLHGQTSANSWVMGRSVYARSPRSDAWPLSVMKTWPLQRSSAARAKPSFRC